MCLLSLLDDYPVVETASGCKVFILQSVRCLTSWAGPMRRMAIRHPLSLLSLRCHFRPSGHIWWTLVISNKQSRIEKLAKMLDDILDRGGINYAQASELQGLLNFAVGYFSGRSLKHLVSAFVPLTGDRSTASLSTLKSLCAYAKHMITNLPSRGHDVNGVTRAVVVFTDGAWEQRECDGWCCQR